MWQDGTNHGKLERLQLLPLFKKVKSWCTWIVTELMKFVVQEIAANFQSTSTVVFYRNEFQEDFIVDLKKKIRFWIPKMWTWKREWGDSMLMVMCCHDRELLNEWMWISKEIFASIKIKRMLHRLARTL